MGFFGGSETYVASSIYNLAGDVNKRPNYLKSVIASNVIGESNQSMGDAVSSAYQGGPGMKLRSFYRWAAGDSGYSDTVGFTSGQISTGNTIDPVVLAAQIPHDAGHTVALQSTDMGLADCTWWAEQYILDHHPERLNTNWHADYLNGQVVITYADASVESFTPVGFDPAARYLFAAYNLTTGRSAAAVVTGNTVPLGSSGSFPATDGWTLDSNLVTAKQIDLHRTVVRTVTYSDGRPAETSTQVSTTTMAYAETHAVYEKTDYKGIDPASPTRNYSIRSVMSQDQTVSAVAGAPSVASMTDTAGPGVSMTITITTTVESAQFARSYRVDTQDITNNTFSPLKVFIYQFGSGNPALDAMFSAPADMGTFFPYIPVRINNVFVSGTYEPDVYSMAKKAYKKATSGKFDDLVAKIADNASLKDIDYAYIVFGVSLNVAEVASKRYIYAFFQNVLESQSFDMNAYGAFKTRWALAKASQDAYYAWQQANYGTGTDNIATMPVLIPYPPLPEQSVQIVTSKTSNINFNMKISWNGVERSSGAGMKSADHKVGDVWFEINGSDAYDQAYPGTPDDPLSRLFNTFQVSNVTLYNQVDSNNWTALTLYGLTHQNMIYNGKSVDISVIDALNDTSESGFIIPLHEGIFQDTSLVDATQMSTACCYAVFNCYQVVKQKWYTTGLFQVIMIIIIIIITIVSWGSGTGPAISAYSAIGTAIGLSGLAAVLAGLAITMIASMLLMKLIGVAAKALFGDKVGAIVGAIATVVVMVVGANMEAGGNWTTALSSLTEPQNLIALTSAVGNGIAEYTQYEVKDVIKQTQDMLGQYNTEMKQVSDLYAQNIGMDQGMFDPMALTDVAAVSPRAAMTVEPPSSFLNRTLMTGSDVAELNSSLISQYTSLTLDLNQNLVT
jgi:hypothetical protein